MFETARKLTNRRAMNGGIRHDGAESKLLVAELVHFQRTMGQDRIERVIGRAYDAAFISECFAEYAVPRLLKQRGYPFDIRVAPTIVLEEALQKLWAAAPEKIIWRA